MDRHTYHDAQSWLKVDHISNPEDSSVLPQTVNFFVLNQTIGLCFKVICGRQLIFW